MRSDRYTVGDRVISVHNSDKGEVVEVNHQWGWYVVEFDDGYRRRYDFTGVDNSAFFIDHDRVNK